ncbi:MAG: hypothetical protein HQL93_04205 [Magnetococcales bacterium]|nr:hypothetical protein [Magnetococcales bacterium]
MASTGIAAKGSTISIGTATGGANNITAVSLTNPCRVTLASSIAGYSVGNVITIAGITGTTQLNGNNYVIEYMEPANKIISLAGVNALDYTAWSAGGTVTPVTLTQIKNVQTFSGFDGSVTVHDVTDMDSPAKEFLAGIIDEGGFSFECLLDNGDAGQLAISAAKGAAAKTFKLILPNAKVATFSGLVKKFNASGSVDGVVKRSCDIQISGLVVWS